MCRATVTEVTAQMAAANLADDGEVNPFGALMPPPGAPTQDTEFVMPLPWEGASGTHVPVPSPTLSASVSPSPPAEASSLAEAWPWPVAAEDYAPPTSPAPAPAPGRFIVFGIDFGAEIDFDADMDALMFAEDVYGQEVNLSDRDLWSPQHHHNLSYQGQSVLTIILQSMAHCADLGMRPQGPHFIRVAYVITTEAVKNRTGWTITIDEVREILDVQRKKFRLWVELGTIDGVRWDDDFMQWMLPTSSWNALIEDRPEMAQFRGRTLQHLELTARLWAIAYRPATQFHRLHRLPYSQRRASLASRSQPRVFKAQRIRVRRRRARPTSV
ncbi:hypothetical protein B0T24DRAFT_725525 [Lasiosphaeria ovina]|uniref:Uncharacterized protein n=1 Tax=Lasiosphaeria ovina TaxID=92902 RepID=A0AAE0JRY9_9PEZI|nr:hypothetical protein B0T24DRAFT_725525 [Lasiosphaeria ovina]